MNNYLSLTNIHSSFVKQDQNKHRDLYFKTMHVKRGTWIFKLKMDSGTLFKDSQ